ncbi:MAG: AgmX/PglI C-terminal domain-containing protein [Deltaproteobacteria bacterium]|nr:AgmX/PglI C-terminal domain-containing protein [Deltaproteobacteria bacterium]
MSGCSPETLARLVEGRLEAPLRDATVAHATGCARCRAELRRLRGARDGFEAARTLEAPELPWEQMGAQIAWQLRQAPPTRARWPLFVLGGAALAAAAVLTLWLLGRAGTGARGDGGELAAPAPSAMPSPAPLVSPPPVRPAAAPGQAWAFLIEAELIRGRAGAALAALSAEAAAAEPLLAGDRLRAVGGRVGLVLETRTALVLEAGTEAALRALDAETIELELARGRVTLEVARRSPTQRLSVLAGGKRVTVRGTRFAVALQDNGALAVGVGHGRVELGLADAGGGPVLSIDGGSVAELSAGEDVSNARVRALTEDERAELEIELPLPGTLAGAELPGATRLLRVGSSQAAVLTLDGAPVGQGSALVRVLPGRHLLEASSGAHRVSRWIDSALGEGISVVRVPAPGPRSGPSAARTMGRPLEIDAQVRAAGKAIKACYAEGLSRRPDLDGTVLLRVDVGADGVLAPVEVSSSTLGDSGVERCLKSVVQRWRLPPGEPSTVIYPIELHQN